MNKNLFILVVIIATMFGLGASILLNQKTPVQLKSLTWFGEQAKPLPSFNLTDHNNLLYNNQSFSGQWNLLFFGYTNCPDICPDTMQMLNTMMQQLPDDETRQQIQITFISVDPDRDHSENLKAYVSYFNPDFKAVSGDINQIKILTDAVGILFYSEPKPEGYDVGHSGALVLIDPESRYTGVFGSPHDAQKIAHDMNALING